MSKLSNWLEKKAGVPKAVQRGMTSVVNTVPGVGAVARAAQGIADVFGHPMTGVVAPSDDPISRALGFGPGGVLDTTANAGHGRIAAGANGACPSGWHLNKHKLADGTPARSVCVRNRSMNPMNGRAIARATRRIKKGEKLLRKIFSVEGHAHGKIRPKRKR